jgi:T-complex protein 1 subunit theta
MNQAFETEKLSRFQGTVLIKSAAELKTFSRGEETLLESQIKEIADTGVKVIVAGGKIADMALHYLNKYGIMGVRLMSKFDIRRVARTVGATALPKLVPPTKEETGHCDHVYVDEVGDSSVGKDCLELWTTNHKHE